VVAGFDPTFIDAHLAAAQDSIDVALRHAFEMTREKIVNALARVLIADYQERCLVGSGDGNAVHVLIFVA
jgi:hypothetical protein